ncbi:phosphotransferase enzyme family protein [Algoriphagus sediminis]|uniref:Aminoglycoside phosphotransferase family protein n=1 Tax=Algoriphagus sediminis TaxID=3057113 RepID=A0ABT7YCJ2_9BACT|nr:aminoglycoside phosphotransferase family protein [Algoriphagus sediminis]MDN3204244.1 aminoglycoside phosphotransferase family protein [Algoriphagus sediminis]
MNSEQIHSVLSHFPIGNLEAMRYKPFGNGHIHRTFLVETKAKKFILQEFNDEVFKSPEKITKNQKTLHSEAKFERLPFQVPLPIPRKSGELLYRSKEGLFRLFDFVEGKSIDYPENPEQAFQAAKSFGSFAAAMNSIHPESLSETIPDFHRLDLRYERFLNVLSQSTHSEELNPITDFYKNQGNLVYTYSQSIRTLPLRITHNDTKLNNLIFSEDLKNVNAVVDLDTIMPGYIMYDFGDLVRTAASGADENSEDLAQVNLQVALFEALLKGYLSGFGKDISKPEIESLKLAGEYMTLMMGLRFLTDHLEGNVYYHVHHPLANLNRAKNQMKLLGSMQEKREEIEGIFNSLGSDKN